jgi:hypothetical protein
VLKGSPQVESIPLRVPFRNFVKITSAEAMACEGEGGEANHGDLFEAGAGDASGGGDVSEVCAMEIDISADQTVTAWLGKQKCPITGGRM